MVIKTLALAPLSIVQKWGDLCFLFIVFFLSILINWSTQQVYLENFGILRIISVVGAILVVSGFVFKRRWVDIKEFTIALRIYFPHASNIWQLGILLFSFGAVFGPAVTLYVITCYLAFVPLFVDNQNSIRFDSLVVAIAFGILISGLLYILSPMVGLDGAFTIPVVLVALSAVNIFRHKRGIVPIVEPSSYFSLVVLTVLFVAYGGAVLAGSLIMGMSEYPSILFNVDTPYRLTDAHAILELTSYPPELLTTKGVVQSYHYGAPAAVAALAGVTGLPVHKSMFLVVLPLLLFGSFSAVCFLSRSVLRKKIYWYVSILLVLPFVQLGEEVYHRFIYNTQAYDLSEMLGIFAKGFIPYREYHAENFSGGIWDVSTTAGVFLSVLAVILLIKKQTLHVLITAPAVILLTFFSKFALVPAVTVLAGISVLASWKNYGLTRFLGYSVLCSGLMLIFLYLFGAFDAVGSSVAARNADQIVSLLSKNRWILVQLIFVTCLSTLFFALYFCSATNYRLKEAMLLNVAALACVFVCFLVVTLTNVQGWGSIYKASWMGIPLICTALMVLSGSSRYHKYIVNAIIAPILLVALMGQWHKIQQFGITTIQPEKGHEYSDNSEIAEALSTIPKERCNESIGIDCYGEYVRSYEDLLFAYKTTGGNQAIESWGQIHWESYGKFEHRNLPPKNVIVTNDFQYLWLNNYQIAITGIFGHQAYAIDAYWFRHDRELRNLQAQRIHLQKALLSSLFNRSRLGFSNEVISLAEERGWTHFLLRKDAMGKEFRSPSISFSNQKSNDTLLGNSDSPDVFPIMLRREYDTNLDRVSCSRKGLIPDSRVDNVFIADLTFLDGYVGLYPEITLIELRRENPSGIHHTSNHNYILGVAHDSESPLINSETGPDHIVLTPGKKQLWLFSCADGHDTPNSRYFVQITFSSQVKIPEYNSTDDIPLRKTFENNGYAVYEF